MDTNEPTNLIINAYPTPKEQLIGGLIAIGISAGSMVVIFGGFALSNKISDAVSARKLSKANKTDQTVE